MADLAHMNPYKLRKFFGPQNGLRLYALAWGVDRTLIREKSAPQSRSIGNSQVLPGAYTKPDEIALVIREVTEQVATRLRFQKLLAGTLSIHVGNEEVGKSINKTIRLQTPTNVTQVLQTTAVELFQKHWRGGSSRRLDVYFGELSSAGVEQLDLFLDATVTEKQQKLDQAVDSIRQKFGFAKLVHTSSLENGGTAISRANLVGGHNGGNAYE